MCLDLPIVPRFLIIWQTSSSLHHAREALKICTEERLHLQQALERLERDYERQLLRCLDAISDARRCEEAAEELFRRLSRRSEGHGGQGDVAARPIQQLAGDADGDIPMSL